MLTNFAQVTPTIARSGRPRTDEDYEWIWENVDTVIVLDGDDETRVERARLGAGPVAVLSFPISDWQIYNPFRAAPQQTFDGVLRELNLLGRKLIHCLHGQDRTGLAVAEYRVRNGWTKDAAMDEAFAYGYHRWPLNRGLAKTWTAFS